VKYFVAKLYQKIATLQGLRSSPTFFKSVGPQPTGEIFVDSRGRSYDLLDDFRSFVKPNWHSFFHERQPVAKPEKITGIRSTVASVEAFLQIYNLTFKDARVLEIGCHGGAHSFAVAELGASSVYATDIVEYWERENSADKESENHSEAQAVFLERFQFDTARYFPKIRNVSFGHLDVTQLDQVDSFNAIVSWETLEHVPDVEVAMVRMFAALKPGGFCFHEYNPFFCLSGGHSLCNLDFPFGHVVLNDDDFANYLDRFRPSEKKLALEFFRKSLNRMTLKDLQRYIKNAGFESLAFIKWPGRGKLPWITSEVLSAATERYPSVTIHDLLSDQVWILLKKPI
jgi:2-polyprenyl-3-methyl-5-hydroxy-6-metoxy-1,4-benzoquinol methylase